MATEDSDPAILDWAPNALTDLDDSPIEPSGPVTAPHVTRLETEPDTAPHRSLDYLAGRESGLSDGVDAALRELGAALLDAGLTPPEASLIVLRVQLAALDLG